MSAPELPAALSPWRAQLAILPRELAVSMGPLLQRLSVLVGSFPAHRQGDQGDPNGLDGISRRGRYERLMLSQWALAQEAPDEFVRRAAQQELQFLALARQRPDGRRRSVALFDAGPAQMGAPRIFQVAALVLLVRSGGVLMLAPIHSQVRRGPQAGFSLVELMISMVIGMVVVGAVLAAYLGAGATTRTSRAMSQITEDASVALSVLRSGIGMVGYSNPTGLVGNKFTKSYLGKGLFGCNTTFEDASASIDALACANGAGPNAIAVAYEADTANSVVNVDNVPRGSIRHA